MGTIIPFVNRLLLILGDFAFASVPRCLENPLNSMFFHFPVQKKVTFIPPIRGGLFISKIHQNSIASHSLGIATVRLYQILLQIQFCRICCYAYQSIFEDS